MKLAEMNKAIAAGVTAGAAMYFQRQAEGVSLTHALWPAVITGLITLALTWVVPNISASNLSALARDIQAALHITKMVADTPPVVTEPTAPTSGANK